MENQLNISWDDIFVTQDVTSFSNTNDVVSAANFLLNIGDTSLDDISAPNQPDAKVDTKQCYRQLRLSFFGVL